MAADTLIFARSEWLWALPAVTASGVLLWLWAQRTTRRRLKQFTGARLLHNALTVTSRRGVTLTISVLALLLLVLALARPLTGPRTDRAEGSGVDVVVALDVSKSMCVEDVAPNRLSAVKKELGEWFKQLRGDRAGLVVFAGEAFVQAPITFDYTALDYVLQQTGPQSVSLGGTNIPKAVETARRLLANHRRDEKFLLIVSDGENLEGDALSAVRTAFTSDGIRVFTVGVGTLAGGPVPARDYATVSGDARQFVNSEYGTRAHSRLDDRALRALAEAGGGRYFEFKPGAGVFQAVHQQGLLPLARQSRTLTVRDFYEWYQVPLSAAILLLLLLPFIPENKKNAANLNVGVATVKPVTFSILLVCTLTLTPLGSLSASPTDDAEKLLATGQADEAVELMRQAARADEKNPRLFYNYALTAYRAGRYEEALKLFETLLLTAPELAERVSFQMGNAQARLGQQLDQEGTRAAAILSYERALADYDTADTRDARANKALTLALLERALLTAGASQSAAADAARAAGNLGGEEQRLRHALQAFERAAELNVNNRDTALAVEKIRARLADNLAAQATAAAQQAEELKAARAKIEEVVKERQYAVAKLDEALTLVPDHENFARQKQEQLEKISEDLTDAAREQSAEPLAKDKLNNKDRKVLQEAKDKLDQALTLKPDNGSAADLEKKVAEKLAADLTANGERDLGAAEKNSAADPGKAANKAEQALQKFEQASALTPGNERAEAGAAQAKAMLPGLLAADAARNTENAKASMQGSPSPSAADLQNAVGMLEKADAAMGRALALSADSGNTAQLQQQSSTVSGLLTDARGRLAAVMAETGLPADSNQSTGDDADGDVPPNTDGEEQEGDRTQPRSRMYSLQDLRTKLKNPKNEDNFWHQKYRDW